MPGNKVKMECSPSINDLMRSIESGEDMTSAQAYAMKALRIIREESKIEGPTKILIPRIGRV